MENELWIDIVGYKGLYQVSNKGRVKSLVRKFVPRDRILSDVPDGEGDYIVGLSKDGVQITRTIHQLVAESFLGFVRNGCTMVVNHIDFDRKNNNAKNLEIVSVRDNNNKKHMPSSSKYTGVNLYKKTGRWRAGISINGKKTHIGYYATEIEASNAYQEKLTQLSERVL